MLKIVSNILVVSSLIFAPVHLVWADKTFVVAFPQDTLKNDFRKNEVLAVQREFKKHPNIKFIFNGAKGNTAQHVKNVEEYFTQGIDLLILSPEDPDALVPLIEKIHARGIPIVVTDRQVNSDKISTFIHADDKNIGATAAKFMLKKLNYKGTILMIKGLPKAVVTQDRESGFMQVVKQHPDVKVIKTVGNFLRGDTIKAMEKIHANGEHYDAIYAHSDSMISGVRLFYKAKGLEPSSKIMVGIDYITEAQKAILAGEQTASILFSLGAKETVDASMAILNGQTISKDIITETALVTKENALEVEPIF